MNADTFSLTPPQSMLPLQGIGPERDVPEYRLRNAADAQALAANLWQAAGPRVYRAAACQGQIDGNPPYSPQKMRAQGRASDPNFNTLEARALWAQGCVPYYDLFTGDRHYVDLRFSEEAIPDSRLRQRVSDIVTEEYDRLLTRWNNWDLVGQRMIGDFVLHGKGYLQWENSKSWRVRKIPHQNVLVPDGTVIDLDEELECVVVLVDYTVSSLYGKIRNDGAATAIGWNVSEVYRALQLAVPNDPASGSPADAVAVQQMLRDNDIYVSSRSSVVRTAHIYVREFSGKWSHCVVRRDNVPTGSGMGRAALGDEDSHVGYMFESRGKYDSILDGVVPFFFDAGATSWNGATGLGRDIFAAMQLKDRLACNLAQAAFLRGSLVLQPREALDKKRMQAIVMGSVTWLPAGVDVHQGSVLGDLEGNIAITRELDQTVQRNTGIYRPTIEKQSGNPQTLGEFQMKFAQATALTSSAVDRFWGQMDLFYSAQGPRVFSPGGGGKAAEEARLFKKRCERRGVPADLLKWENVESLTAWRTMGKGSAGMRQQSLGGLMQGVYPLLKPQGQEALLRDVITSATTVAQTERYMPQDEWAGVPTDQQWAATVENDSLRNSMPAKWTPSQNNIIHAQVHMEAAAQAAASLQQGADQMQVLSFLEAVGQHVLVHLQREQANPITREAVKQLTAQWKQLAGVADDLMRKAQAEAAARQAQAEQTQTVMSDAELAQFTAERKAALADAKGQHGIQLKERKQAADEALKARKLEADIGLKADQTGAQIQLADASTAAEIHRANAQAVAEMRRKAAEAAGKERAE